MTAILLAVALRSRLCGFRTALRGPDHQVIKFKRAGTFVMQIGKAGMRGPSDPIQTVPNGTPLLGRPVAVANDGLVKVCDRLKNRIQVFNKNGTFVKEFFSDRNTLGNGSAYNAGLSPDPRQKFLFNADGENQHIWTFVRQTGEVVGLTGRGGRQAGEFTAVHSLAVDSKGNIYTGEVDAGMRLQKFSRVDDDDDDHDHHRR